MNTGKIKHNKTLQYNNKAKDQLKKPRIGITGQTGFIGTHLSYAIYLNEDRFRLIPFEDDYFQSEIRLDDFVKKCDVIVHLAAMNRHNDPDVLYKTNIRLVQKLIDSLERTSSLPYVIMASSLQEERDNPYGNSKREGRMMLADWAAKHKAKFSGLIIPNVFGPFGIPFYNSVISTFSYQIANGQQPKIEIDAELKLIYVADLAKSIISLIDISFKTEQVKELVKIDFQKEKKVSALLNQLLEYRATYQDQGVFPDLSDPFDIALFNTYRSYMPLSFFPVTYQKHTDKRGDFIEVMKFNTSGQVSCSTTKPGVTRGNHFHLRKVERFSIIQGKACIRLRRFRNSDVVEYIVDGMQPAYIDMPIWFSHNITNIGGSDLLTLFWINEAYNPSDPDTYSYEV